MRYIFYKKEIDTTKLIYYFPKVTNREDKVLENIYFTKSGTVGIKHLILGIEESKTKEKGDEYKWANEDVVLFANKNGILLIDSMAQRGGVYNPDIISLRLTHDEMLTFLKDFKKFIVDNKQ